MYEYSVHLYTVTTFINNPNEKPKQKYILLYSIVSTQKLYNECNILSLGGILWQALVSGCAGVKIHSKLLYSYFHKFPLCNVLVLVFYASGWLIVHVRVRVRVALPSGHPQAFRAPENRLQAASSARQARHPEGYSTLYSILGVEVQAEFH